MADYQVNRQIGDYVVISKVALKAPYFVKMAGADDEFPLSTHFDVTDAVQAILRYQKADKRRSS